jgi:hypothetical protein
LHPLCFGYIQQSCDVQTIIKLLIEIFSFVKALPLQCMSDERISTEYSYRYVYYFANSSIHAPVLENNH